MIISKASLSQVQDLGIQLWLKGLTPEVALEYIKSQKYTINSISYPADRVATVVGALTRVNAGLKSGALKGSKAKGLHLA